MIDTVRPPPPRRRLANRTRSRGRISAAFVLVAMMLPSASSRSRRWGIRVEAGLRAALAAAFSAI